MHQNVGGETRPARPRHSGDGRRQSSGEERLSLVVRRRGWNVTDVDE